MTAQSTKSPLSSKPDNGPTAPRTAIFPGSFNPFTTGHASIVGRGLRLFDRIVIAVGYNRAKASGADDARARAEAIAALYAGEPRVEVITFSGLAVDAARDCGACCAIKGIRSVKDFEYERDMADINRQLSGLETVILYSLPELSAVSSSIVRELQAFGADTSAFLPTSKNEAKK